MPNKKSRFHLLLTPENGFGVTFIDREQRFWRANTPDALAKENHWYRLAATSDGSLLRLYVDCGEGKGYELAGSTPLGGSGSTAMDSCGSDCSWAVGRCRVAQGTAADGFFGWIDEVRICDEALPPEEFLFSQGAGSK